MEVTEGGGPGGTNVMSSIGGLASATSGMGQVEENCRCLGSEELRKIVASPWYSSRVLCSHSGEWR